MEFGDFMLIISPIFPKPWNCRKLFISLRQASWNCKHGENAVRQLQEQQANEQQHIRQAASQATAEKDKTIRLLQSALKTSRHILNVLGDILYKVNEVFKRAIDAIIRFGTEQHQSFFAPSEAADIKSVMQEYGETTEQQNAVGAWLCDYAESRQPFDKIKHRHTLKEVGDVAEGKYDWKIGRLVEDEYFQSNAI